MLQKCQHQNIQKFFEKSSVFSLNFVCQLEINFKFKYIFCMRYRKSQIGLSYPICLSHVLHYVVTIVPLLFPTLYGKRGIFTHSPLLWVFDPLSFHCYHVHLPCHILTTLLMSTYLGQLDYRRYGNGRRTIYTYINTDNKISFKIKSKCNLQF